MELIIFGAEAKGIDLVEGSNASVPKATAAMPRTVMALLSGLGSGDISAGGLRKNDFRYYSVVTCVYLGAVLILSMSEWMSMQRTDIGSTSTSTR